MIEGICDYCSRPAILQTCSICGAKVCPQHYVAEKQICTAHPGLNRSHNIV